MRSKFLVCAAVAALGVSSWFVSVARAADAKSAKSAKDAAKKPLELHADDKSIKKQTQWEDKVMGPDSTRRDLEKIARARAINEKAEKDREKQAAIETTAPAPKAAPAKKSEVSLISPEKNEASRPHEISPQLASEAAQKAPAPVKPADDKFIDKLLREDAPSKKKASSNDKELDSLLAGVAKEKSGGHKRGDSVDDLLKTADKGPAMPAPRAQSGGLPDWAKQPEIAPTPVAPPPPPPVAVKPAAKNTGVIQVVQGAAGNAPAVIAPARPAATVASKPGRKPTIAKAPVAWSDPFADKRPVASAQAPKKEPASRPAASDTSWNDPFANDPGEGRKASRRAAPTAAPSTPASAPKRNEKPEPAHGPGSAGWKDPFTKAPSEPTRAPVAMRELSRNESSKWEIAARHPAARATSSDSHAAGGWGVIKKRAH